MLTRWKLILSMASMLSSLPALGQSAHGHSGCAQGLSQRTPLQVWQSHVAAIQAGDTQAIACDYADDATVILPGQVIIGRTNIVNSLIAFEQQLGAIPTVTSVTTSGIVLFIEYTLQTPNLIVPDGADTYVIQHGHIQYQTVHATFEPQTPSSAPVAAAR